jgi:3-methyladenine DNA glycosylase AlkD
LQRKIAKEAEKRLIIENVSELLNSKIHEKRLIGLLILIEKYNQAKKQGNKEAKKTQEQIFNLYLKKAQENKINNWDLVDLSASKIIGDYLSDKDREVLYELAKGNLWEKRISIISCFAFLPARDFKDAMEISKLLLQEKHDLLHKAVGWTLREIWKRNREIVEKFLKENYKNIPRTTLRYAIEKMEEGERREWLSGDL